MRRSRCETVPKGFLGTTFTVGELVAVDVVDDDPEVDRLDASMLCFSGDAGVCTRGGGTAQSKEELA